MPSKTSRGGREFPFAPEKGRSRGTSMNRIHWLAVQNVPGRDFSEYTGFMKRTFLASNGFERGGLSCPPIFLDFPILLEGLWCPPALLETGERPLLRLNRGGRVELL